MTREDLIKSPEYWITNAQLDLYESAMSFMKETGKNRKELAEHLGVTKSYVTQLLNGDFDHRLSKFIELSLAFGYVPKINFIPIEDYIVLDSMNKAQWDKKKFSESVVCREIQIETNREYVSYNNVYDKESA